MPPPSAGFNICFGLSWGVTVVTSDQLQQNRNVVAATLYLYRIAGFNFDPNYPVTATRTGSGFTYTPKVNAS